MRKGLCGLGAAVTLLVTAVPAVGSAAAAAPSARPATTSTVTSTVTSTTVAIQGFIPVPGAKLEYTVDLPSATGKYPTAMVYDGYCEGPGALACNDVASAHALLAAGFAVIGVSIRGTSCSTGIFDAFTDQEWRDGAAAVEWVARQPWSNGRVGMIGDSFPGITQLGVAGLHPAHLDAIAPFQVTTDMYRDVAYPGGMANLGFGAFWAGVDQPLNSYRSGLDQALKTKDPGCVASMLENLAELPFHNVALQGFQHAYDGAWWQQHEPGANVERIHIPTFGCFTWQDDEVSSRGSSYLSQLDPKTTWVVASNGYHGMCELSIPRVTDELVAFFDRFVKGVHNGFARTTPHVQLWHEAHVDSAGHNVPSWVTTYPSYASMPVRPISFYFNSDGSLSLTPPKSATAPARSYVYPLPDLGNEDGVVVGQHNLLWKSGDPTGGSLAYTTPALTHDTELFGSGSANLWLSSTAPDTDLQITLTEVRPDGQEVYIDRGWLRASRRKLAVKRSTVLAPVQTDQAADVEDLTPGKPTYLRIQLDPFDYVFRKGSRIRLWIDAPTGLTGGWSLNFLNIPGVNSIYSDARHPSAIVLGDLRSSDRAVPPMPRCDTILNQPCRKNQASLPVGSLSVPR
ncbi:MAG TPA: CocE/NonD family hydrolase [Mycobacteriales bacterium]|nr:CocE/NonD family hydrolase [Mycobacteriales bacterium]